jgi:glycosyltransferase involved in cell wall biosynthesis
MVGDSQENLPGMNESAPLFSIGVTTYNRTRLLKRCLDSLVNQTYPNFEVIVGNDYVREPLSAEDVGISDPRIRYINHAINLGERRNLNALLAAARGRYFTWQFDDDLYADDFLERVHQALSRFTWPACAFTSFQKIFDEGKPKRTAKGKSEDIQLLSGVEFLRRYLRQEIRAMGLSGVYNVEYLRQLGGVEALTSGPFALYSEYLLLVLTSLLDRVAYINDPLVYYYVHEGSWGNVNSELDLYRQAGMNLFERSLQVLSHQDGSQEEVRAILKLVVHDFVKKSSMKPGFTGFADAANFLTCLQQKLESGSGRHRRVRIATTWRWFVFPFVKAKVKKVVPGTFLTPIQKVHAHFQ